MGSSLAKMVGQRVTVFSNTGGSYAKDEGVVEEFDGIFLRLNSNGEILFFPYTAIRLVKVTA